MRRAWTDIRLHGLKVLLGLVDPSCQEIVRGRIMKKVILFYCCTLFLFVAPVCAQSLKPESPAPLQSGINRGTIDSVIGTHYWYFEGKPGKTQVHATLKSMGLFGNAQRTSVAFTLSDSGNTWHSTKVLTSDSKPVDCTFDGLLKKPAKLIMTVAPPSNSLLRVGGDYELEATGSVAFGQKSTADPIIGVYKWMSGYSKDLGACKFTPDGKVITASGANGDWKLFDEDTRMYVINIDGETRHSLKFVPGRGLVDEQGIPAFQLVR